MKKKILLLAPIIILAISILVISNNTSASGETFSGTSSYSITRDDQVTFSDLQINGTGNDVLNINIYVPYGTLEMGTTTGLSFNTAESGNDLNFIGNRTNLNNALKTLKFTPSNNQQKWSGVDLQITIGGAEGTVYSPYTHHLYQSSGISAQWEYAKTGAETFTQKGATGYLATIMSQEEQDAVSMLRTGGWLGATDLNDEGEWTWRTGPEAGQNFWIGGPDGNTVLGYYANWAGGMPDNYTGSNPAGENCMEMYSGNRSDWNDQNCDSDSIVSDYIIEYGDDEHSFDLPYKNISIAISNGHDLNRDGRQDVYQSNVKDLQDLDGNWISIQLAPNCTFSSAEIVAESSLSPRDQDYNYPGGLLNFSASCSNSNSSTMVRIYYYGKDTDEVTLRKFNPQSGQYTEFVPGSKFTVHVGEDSISQFIYNISDGSEFDTDGSDSNGSFTDPLGIGVLGPEPSEPVNSSSSDNSASNNSSPNKNSLAGTGQNQYALLTLGMSIVLVAILLINIQSRQKSIN